MPSPPWRCGTPRARGAWAGPGAAVTPPAITAPQWSPRSPGRRVAGSAATTGLHSLRPLGSRPHQDGRGGSLTRPPRPLSGRQEPTAWQERRHGLPGAGAEGSGARSGRTQPAGHRLSCLVLHLSRSVRPDRPNVRDPAESHGRKTGQTSRASGECGTAQSVLSLNQSIQRLQASSDSGFSVIHTPLKTESNVTDLYLNSMSLSFRELPSRF